MPLSLCVLIAHYTAVMMSEARLKQVRGDISSISISATNTAVLPYLTSRPIVISAKIFVRKTPGE